jgi:hypothetical protein
MKYTVMGWKHSEDGTNKECVLFLVRKPLGEAISFLRHRMAQSCNHF